MPQAVHSDLFLYADDSALTFQHKDVHTTEHQLNKDFANLCEWIVDNKLSIHLGEEKTKCTRLPVINRFEQCVISVVFKFINGDCPYYLIEVFKFASEGNVSLRNNFLKLKRPFRNTSTGHKALSFIGPSFRNQIPQTLKKTDNLNTFKHNLKKHFFNQMS